MSNIGDYFKKAINANHLELQDGNIRLLDFRMVMLPAFTWTSLIENLYARHGEEAFELLFEMGKAHGSYAVEKYGEKHNIPKKQFLDQSMDSSLVLGLGKFSVEKFNLESGEIVYRLDDSPFPESFENSEALSDLDRPIDELQRGMCQAVSEALLEMEVETEETHCKFQGDPYCRFVARSKD